MLVMAYGVSYGLPAITCTAKMLLKPLRMFFTKVRKKISLTSPALSTQSHGFKWSNFTVEEQAKVIVAPRSNNEMDGSKLSKEFPEMLPITEALIKYVFEPNKRT
ncbi:unnamed protein product [Brassica oleracea var. botrytis]|uniref:Uncharacterized protein n=1 Tax=Brassica oleracea TaxID=3712 RepID=A0A3P6BIZ0_BRAOL|nr:unnamed protein product [Brassica oleracea]